MAESKQVKRLTRNGIPVVEASAEERRNCVVIDYLDGKGFLYRCGPCDTEATGYVDLDDATRGARSHVLIHHE